jgi:hypothetical protein
MGMLSRQKIHPGIANATAYCNARVKVLEMLELRDNGVRNHALDISKRGH